MQISGTKTDQLLQISNRLGLKFHQSMVPVAIFTAGNGGLASGIYPHAKLLGKLVQAGGVSCILKTLSWYYVVSKINIQRNLTAEWRL